MERLRTASPENEEMRLNFIRSFIPFIPLYMFVAIVMLMVMLVAGCERQETGPRQPIAFSHARHAGEYQINCQYCHSGVRKGTNAYIP